jgi:hypothetical protein
MPERKTQNNFDFRPRLADRAPQEGRPVSQSMSFSDHRPRVSQHGQHGLKRAWFRSDVIERQFAHGERDKVRAAYNHAQHLSIPLSRSG